MDFKALHDKIPYVIGKETYVVTYSPYRGVTLSMPGRHQRDTDPIGGDFVVMVTCPSIGWKRHSFTHQDIFGDIQTKYSLNPVAADDLVTDYVRVVHGTDPNDIPARDLPEWAGTLDSDILLRAGQCLAVAEHRRYAKFENKGGGRYLPVRFLTGITEGLWTAEEANAWQRKGRPGLDALAKIHGAPEPLSSRLLAERGLTDG